MTGTELLSNHPDTAKHPIAPKPFLAGRAGAGKTNAAIGRLLHLLESGVPASSMLVIVPQRTLATPYYEALNNPDVDPGGQVTVFTVRSLVQPWAEIQAILKTCQVWLPSVEYA